MGVRLVNLGDGQTLVAIARNAESAVSVEGEGTDEGADEGTDELAGDEGGEAGE
jgi:hypothetical protein